MGERVLNKYRRFSNPLGMVSKRQEESQRCQKQSQIQGMSQIRHEEE